VAACELIVVRTTQGFHGLHERLWSILHVHLSREIQFVDRAERLIGSSFFLCQPGIFDTWNPGYTGHVFL